MWKLSMGRFRSAGDKDDEEEEKMDVDDDDDTSNDQHLDVSRQNLSFLGAANAN